VGRGLFVGVALFCGVDVAVNVAGSGWLGVAVGLAVTVRVAVAPIAGRV